MKKIALQKVLESLPDDFNVKIMTYINGGELLIEGQKNGTKNKKLIMFFGEGGGFKRQLTRKLLL